MSTKHIQFNRQKVAALLLAGSVLAATVVSLTWTDVSASLAQWGAGSEKAGAMEYDSELPSEFHLRSVKGGRGGISGDFKF